MYNELSCSDIYNPHPQTDSASLKQYSLSKSMSLTQPQVGTYGVEAEQLAIEEDAKPASSSCEDSKGNFSFSISISLSHTHVLNAGGNDNKRRTLSII